MTTNTQEMPDIDLGGYRMAYSHERQDNEVCKRIREDAAAQINHLRDVCNIRVAMIQAQPEADHFQILEVTELFALAMRQIELGADIAIKAYLKGPSKGYQR